MEWKPTDVTISILFIHCRISTCFWPTGPSSGEFTQLRTQQLVQCLYCSGRVHTARAVQTLNRWLCEQLCELSWRWACGPETCSDPAIYINKTEIVTSVGFYSIHYSHLLIQLNTFTHLYWSFDLSYSSRYFWTSVLVLHNSFFILAALFSFLPFQLPGTN
jgi:hypothetical protein